MNRIAYVFILILLIGSPSLAKNSICKAEKITILGAFNVIGDKDLKFKLTVEKSSFAYRESETNVNGMFEGRHLISTALFNATSFYAITLRKVTLSKNGNAPIMNCSLGNKLTLDKVVFTGLGNKNPFTVEKVKEVINSKLCQMTTTGCWF